jgi:hypothetical protein
MNEVRRGTQPALPLSIERWRARVDGGKGRVIEPKVALHLLEATGAQSGARPRPAARERTANVFQDSKRTARRVSQSGDGVAATMVGDNLVANRHQFSRCDPQGDRDPRSATREAIVDHLAASGTAPSRSRGGNRRPRLPRSRPGRALAAAAAASRGESTRTAAWRRSRMIRQTGRDTRK